MKFQSIIVSTLLFFSLTLFATENYKVDNSKSKVEWKAAKVTGEHFGTVSVSEGELTFADDKLMGGVFKMDMNSILVKDLEPGKWKDKLESHLRSDDFFSVEKFPVSTFVITKITHAGDGRYDVQGDLTIKGITKPVAFTAEVNQANGMAKAEIVVDRAEYDIQYRSGSFFENLGDKLIYDEFTLKVDLVFAK